MSVKTTKPVFAVSAEERKEKESERIDKFYIKHQQNLRQEKELSRLHDFIYEEVDYSPQMEPKTWTEPPMPDLSYLYVENRLRVQDKYYNRIIITILTTILTVLAGVIFYNIYLLPVIVACFMGTVYSLHLTLAKRAAELEKSLQDTKAFIESKLQAIQAENAMAKYQFEKAEEARIKQTSDIVEGEPKATIARLDEVLSNLKFPFIVEMQVAYAAAQLIINVILPPQSVIPDTISEVITGRQVDFHEKPFTTFNKQHIEVCTSLGVQICLAVFANLPKMETVCVNGISKEKLEEECWYSLIIAREDLEKVIKCKNGLHAFSVLETPFTVNSVFEVQPQPAINTEWKEETDEIEVRRLAVRSYN